MVFHKDKTIKLLTKSIAGAHFYEIYNVCVNLRCQFCFSFWSDAIVVESLNPKIIRF